MFAANFQKKTYTTANTVAFNLYRSQVDAVSNAPAATCLQLSELEFIGVSAYSYSWDFGDGTTSILQSPQHTFTNLGTYTVTLTVSEGAATASASRLISSLPLFLAVTPAAGNNLSLSWPLWAANTSLYSASNLAPQIVWLPVTNSMVTNGNTLSVTVPIGPGTRFFQLRSP